MALFFARAKSSFACVVASVAEAELGPAFQNAQKAAEFRNTLLELGYLPVYEFYQFYEYVVVNLDRERLSDKTDEKLRQWQNNHCEKGCVKSYQDHRQYCMKYIIPCLHRRSLAKWYS